MSAYKRYMILHGMLAVLGVFMIVKADRLSDTPIAFVVIGLFCIAVAAGKMVLLKRRCRMMWRKKQIRLMTDKQQEHTIRRMKKDRGENKSWYLVISAVILSMSRLGGEG